jgi:hypothetical protein
VRRPKSSFPEIRNSGCRQLGGDQILKALEQKVKLLIIVNDSFQKRAFILQNGSQLISDFGIKSHTISEIAEF